VRDEALAFNGVSILACDCNACETSQPYREIEARMANAVREIGWSMGALPPGTHLATDLQRLDHVFYRGAIRPVTVYAVDNHGGSDHAAIVAEFARG
jgi:endonuclease/exonuclease/phosphatase (EEP) superfamily protein YafD